MGKVICQESADVNKILTLQRQAPPLEVGNQRLVRYMRTGRRTINQFIEKKLAVQCQPLAESNMPHCFAAGWVDKNS